MREIQGIALPSGVCKSLNEADMDTMISVAMGLEPLWENALGAEWKQKISPEKLKAIYKKI
jgi:3-deoxy-alpha-D-manno-octulosonate 8-oxidase